MSSTYPQINIRSKNEISKRISSSKLSQSAALNLINDVIEHFDEYWIDTKSSQPRKQKYIRSAAGTPLNTLLKLIDKQILKPHDELVPGFIFGGISGKNHIDAAFSLIGKRKHRTLLKMDIFRFYEQITRDRVFSLFYRKCNCSVRASNLLADLCCVPVGKKGSGNVKKSIARGFPTSSRLAVWTTLNTMNRLKWRVDQRLKDYDPKIVVFVDDIGITASKAPKSVLVELKTELPELLANSDPNQPLPVNKSKRIITTSFHKGAEHLGILLGRTKISVGRRTQSKIARVKKEAQLSTGERKRSLVNKRNSLYGYLKQIKIANGG